MDTIANFLNQLKTSAVVGKDQVETEYSRIRADILKVMKDNHYLVDYKVRSDKKMIDISLKKDMFTHLKRISTPGHRKYVRHSAIPRPLSGFGLVILSTPKGVISGKEARKIGTGGEVICEVW